MKILFFVQSLGRGGPERTVSQLAFGLARRGHWVGVVALHAIEPGWDEILDPQTLPVTILFRETPGSVFSAGRQLAAATWRLRNLLQAEQIEYLYCTAGPVPPVVGWLATRGFAGVQPIWSQLASLDPSLASSRQRWRQLVRLRALMSPGIPLMISCSSAVQSSAQAAGLRCQKSVIIYIGIDTERFRPDAAARAAMRAEWGIAPEQGLVGLIGRLDPIKGHRAFLQAASILARERDDLRFVCVGDGPEPYRSELRRLGGELGLDERLLWVGAQPFGKMPAAHNALDVLCLSSESEGLPNVIGEAMACGVPCVATRVGGVPEIVGDLGRLVPPGEPAALARAIVSTLISAPPPDALRGRIVASFSAQAMIDATERALRGLPGGREPA